ncbi:hypothetical protein [Clostridium chromiireducens]|uniref:hypothetical protein n=1 Tax=Clostridium chromiireducens TaxID=225345 RepID=UPI001A9B1165|nr:hypothetical protein [Clostridium chromiireducens]
MIINFALILWIIAMISSISGNMNRYKWSLKSFIITGLFITLGLVLFRFSRINLNVFNSSKDMIYKTLENMLLKYGVEYECKKSKINIKNSKVFIRVLYTKFTKTCTVSVSSIKPPEKVIKVFEGFQDELNNQKSDLKSWMGILYIFLSILTFIASILILVLCFFIL